MLTSDCDKLRHDLRNAQDKVSLSLFLSNASGVRRTGINQQLVITLCSGPCLVITCIIMESFYAKVKVKLSMSMSRRNVGVTDMYIAWHQMEVSGQLCAPVTLHAGKETLWYLQIRGWVGARAGVGTSERIISYPCWELNLGSSSTQHSHCTDHAVWPPDTVQFGRKLCIRGICWLLLQGSVMISVASATLHTWEADSVRGVTRKSDTGAAEFRCL